MCKSHAYFDLAPESYSHLSHSIEMDTRIVQSVFIKSSIFKIQNQRKAELKTSENLALTPLFLNSYKNSTQIPDSGIIIERALKRLRVEDQNAFSAYINIRFLLPNSYICKIWFSFVGSV